MASWFLLNDFAVVAIDPVDAVHYDLEWKVPLLLHVLCHRLCVCMLCCVSWVCLRVLCDRLCGCGLCVCKEASDFTDFVRL